MYRLLPVMVGAGSTLVAGCCGCGQGARTTGSGGGAPPTFEPAINEPTTPGLLLGVHLPDGGDAATLADFTARAGGPFAVYGIFVQDLVFPTEWASAVLAENPGAGLLVTLEPYGTFADMYAPDWETSNIRAAVAEFAAAAGSTGAPVFVRFAHEANGTWYPWSPASEETDLDAADYRDAWNNVADLMHTVPGIAMVWSPTVDTGGFLTTYTEIYPGDGAVDWVGLSIYNGRRFQNDSRVWPQELSDQLHGGYRDGGEPAEDFYWVYSDRNNPTGHGKPMMIGETGSDWQPGDKPIDETTLTDFDSIDGPTCESNLELTEIETGVLWNESAERATWSVVTDAGVGALYLSAHQVSDYYVDWNGVTLDESHEGWENATDLCVHARRSGAGADPTLNLVARHYSGLGESTRTREVPVTVTTTEYGWALLPLAELDLESGPDDFSWAAIGALGLTYGTGVPGALPADLYVESVHVGTGTEDLRWSTFGDVDGSFAMEVDAEPGWARLVGDDPALVEREVTGGAALGGGGPAPSFGPAGWWIGGAIAWIGDPGTSDFEGLTLELALGEDDTGAVAPMLRVLLDRDCVEGTGDEASFQFAANFGDQDVHRVYLPRADFSEGASFSPRSVRCLRLDYYTSHGGEDPRDLRLGSVTRVNAVRADESGGEPYKSDWLRQLFALETDDEVTDVSGAFSELRMTVLFDERKFEEESIHDFTLPVSATTGRYETLIESVAHDYFQRTFP